MVGKCWLYNPVSTPTAGSNFAFSIHNISEMKYVGPWEPVNKSSDVIIS